MRFIYFPSEPKQLNNFFFQIPLGYNKYSIIITCLENQAPFKIVYCKNSCFLLFFWGGVKLHYIKWKGIPNHECRRQSILHTEAWFVVDTVQLGMTVREAVNETIPCICKIISNFLSSWMNFSSKVFKLIRKLFFSFLFHFSYRNSICGFLKVRLTWKRGKQRNKPLYS